MKKTFTKTDPFARREAKKYAKPIPSREFIMQYLEKLGRPASYEHLVKALRLRAADKQEALRKRLLAMARDGQVITNRRGSFALVDKLSLVRGLVVGHKDGYGFVILEDGGDDVFLPARQMQRVFHEDRVLVRVVESQRKGRREGVIVEVLEHNTSQVVGRYFKEDGVGFVVPAKRNLSQDILIPEGEQAEAKHGQLVVADIISYSNLRRQATARVSEVLGEHMAPGMEIEVTIRGHGLPHTWPPEVLQQAKQLDTRVRMQRSRKDLRDLPLVTIDGEDAKDFDDAVYCEPRAKGGWRLYVAIADVSFYVRPNTALDQQALLRGNSVYLPGMVVPMLPEELSNELCSLKPKVDRFCMVCEMTISKAGKVNRYQFYEAIMHSAARLTYNQTIELLAGKNSSQKKLLPQLRNLFALYKALSKQRSQRGAIEFETVETQIIFGKNRKIQQIVPRVRNDAHRVIEECMLAANVCAAKYLLRKKIPALYRIHEGPDSEKLEKLRSFLGGLGLILTGGEQPTPQDYAKLLQQIQGRADKHIVQTMLLRSMRQAVYDAENLGHFGLAYEAYGHFTSPIRRYPDLLTHRAIRHAIYGGTLDDFYYDNNAIHNFGEHCSMTERRADEATYDAIGWLKCEYMLNKVGQEFSGIISGVCGFGVFIELTDIYVEGLLHITSLTNDYYEFDAVHYCLRGKRTRKKYCLGDKMRVLVARVNLDERQIDFEIAT